MDDGGFDEGDWDEPDELDWKWIDVDFLDDCNTNDRATTPVVDVRPSPSVVTATNRTFSLIIKAENLQNYFEDFPPSTKILSS